MIVVAGKLFKTNEEYLFDSYIPKQENCGCSGNKVKTTIFLRVIINKKIYDIHPNNAVVIQRSVAQTIQSPEDNFRTLNNTINHDTYYDPVTNSIQKKNYDEINLKQDLNAIYESVNNIPM